MIKLKINTVRGYSGIVSVETDENDIPLSKFWRNRLADSVSDNCVEIIKPKEKKKESTK